MFPHSFKCFFLIVVGFFRHSCYHHLANGSSDFFGGTVISPPINQKGKGDFRWQHEPDYATQIERSFKTIFCAVRSRPHWYGKCPFCPPGGTLALTAISLTTARLFGWPALITCLWNDSGTAVRVCLRLTVQLWYPVKWGMDTVWSNSMWTYCNYILLNFLLALI